jgi:hypothetical protein
MFDTCFLHIHIFFVRIDLEMFAILKLKDVKVLDVNVDNEWNH